MFLRRFAIFTLAALTVGCKSTSNNPQMVAPPPGYAPPMMAPAPSGCSSCGSSTPVVNAPRYTPPMTAAPAIPQTTPAFNPGLALGSPVSPPPAMGPLQVAFKPSVAPFETAKLGTVQVEDTTSIPVPPAE